MTKHETSIHHAPLRKKVLSITLSLMMVIGVFAFVSGFFGNEALLTAHAAELTDVVIGVPETIYLTPANTYSGTSTTVKYYVNNTVSSSGGYTLDAVNNATAGKFYVYSSRIACIDEITVNGATLSGLSATKSGSLFSDTSFTMTLSNGISSSQAQLLEWNIKVTDTEGYPHMLHAYTVAYDPYLSPVFTAIRHKADENDDLFCSGLSWVSGIHGIHNQGGYYPKDNFLPLLGGPTLGNGVSNPDGWFASDKSQQCGLPTPGGWYQNKTITQDVTWVFERSGEGYVNVDRSRYSNLNTIPYLTTGLYVTDHESETTKSSFEMRAYIADITGVSNPITTGTSGKSGSDYTPPSEWNAGWQTLLAGSRDNAYSTTYDNCNPWYNVAINRTVPSSNENVYIRAAIYYKQSGGGGWFDSSENDLAITIMDSYLQVRPVDKSSLRTLIKDCYKYTNTNYPGQPYADFLAAWRNAATVLGDPTRTDVTDVYNALNTAKNALVKDGVLSLNTETTVNINASGKELYYLFKPTTSGNYVFFSYGTGVDSQIYVNELNVSEETGVGTQCAYNDDYSHNTTNTDGKGSDIRVLLGNGTTSSTTQSYTVGTTQSYTVVELTANTTYLVKARCYSSGTGTFPMKVCKGVNITFNGAGGTKGSDNSVTYVMPAGHTMHMDKTSFSRTDHELIAWSTIGRKEQDKSCMEPETITIPDSDTTYYALWNPTNPTVVTTGTEYTVNIDKEYQVVYFSFTPTETRKYYIRSVNSTNDPDSFGLLMAPGDWVSGAAYITSNDDGEGNRQFAIKDTELEAGTTYLIGAKLYNAGTGSYPIRIDPRYTVSYNGNGGSGAPGEQIKDYDKDLTLSSTEPTREHYTFLGWSTDPKATEAEYAKGGTYTANADAVLYAVWKIDSFTVTFKDWDDTELKTEEVDYGADATPPADPSRAADDTYHYEFDGWTGYTNITADKTITATYTPGEHTGEWTNNTATCTAGGTETRTCPTCGKVQTRNTTALGHDMTHNAAVPATDCQNTGTVEYYHCERCNKDFADEQGTTELTDLDDHTYGPHKPVTDEAVPATCTEPGKTEGSHCELCGTVITAQQPVEALGHQMTHNAAVPATDCQNTGTVEYYHCERCNKDFADEQGTTELTDLDDHTYGPHSPVTDAAVPATCTDPGKTEGSHCELCGTVITAQQPVEALGHQMTHNAAVPATDCQNTGTVEYYHCERCNKDFADEQGTTELTDLDDHTYGPHKPVTDAAVPATCTDPGKTEGSHCELCGTVITAQQPVEALGHQMTHNAAAPATDCQHTGTVEYYHCERCNKDFADEQGTTELTDLDDHTAGPHKPVTDAAVPATCTEPGKTEGSHCELCGTVITAQQPVEALGHQMTHNAAAPATDCLHTGTVEYYHCERCNKDFADEQGTTELTDLDDHIYGPHKPVTDAAVPATCTEPGKTEGAHCELCGTVITAQQPVEALGHQMTHNAAAPATDCLHTGTVEYYHCERCNKDFADEQGTTELTDLDDHTYGPHKPVTDEAVPATCTEPGKTEGSHCELCGTVITAQQPVNALGHQMTHNAAVPATDCQNTGTVEYYHCSRCNKDFADEQGNTEITDLDDHTYGPHKPVTDAAVPATCTEPGKTEGSHCELCGTVITAQEPVNALGHQMTHNAAVPAEDCQNTGTVEYYHCERCNKDFADEQGTTELTDLDDHTYGPHSPVTDAAVPATCTEPGKTEGSHCELCGIVLTAQQPVEALGHQMTHNAAIPAEDCQNTGTVEYYHCERCNKDFADEQGTTELTDLDDHIYGPHSPVTDAAVPATCTEPGKTEGSHCKLCGTVLTAQQPVDALGHDLIHHDGKSATCTEIGWDAYDTCSRCDYTTYVEIPALGHDFGEWTLTSEPTCTDKGEETRECARCHETETREVEALGHDWSAWETVTAASVGQDGLDRRICFRCGEVETRTTHVEPGKDRTIQFVVYEGMHYLVHLDGYDYTIYSKTAKAIEWYPTAPLTFEVVTDRDWTYDGFVVMVNQEELAPNADGSYTLPAGTDYKMISIAPIMDLPVIDDVNPTPSGSGACPYCGKVHPAHLWGRIVALIHQILYFFAHLFGKR